MTSVKFPSTFEEDTDTDPPEIVSVDKFTTKHQSSSQEFDLDFEGFWLICLLESERERVSAEVQSFQIPFLGSNWVGKFGQTTAWSDLASHVERQGQPLVRMCVDHAMAESLCLAKTFCHCVIHAHPNKGLSLTFYMRSKITPGSGLAKFSNPVGAEER